jgi:cobalt-zinc-cadmium efflux system membrane fusion protein
MLLVALLILIAGGAYTGMFHIPGLSDEKTEEGEAAPKPLAVDLLPEPAYTLSVPRPVRETLGLARNGKDQVAVARPPKKGHPLVLPGSTALDPARLLRVRARFAPARVTAIGQVRDHWEGQSKFRELRPGDTVHRGDLLGVFHSIDVGNKKNDLYEAIIQLKLDEEILEGAEAATGSVPRVFLLTARKAVLTDRSTISRAENMLRAWDIPQEEIDAVREEAEKADLATIKLERLKKTKKEKDKARGEAKRQQLDRWARVELKAPYDATIIERNVSEKELVQDATTNLFQLARVDMIAVVANAPEDDLPILHKLTYAQKRWTIRTVGAPQDRGLEGPIDEIGYLIDPNMHTAVVKGYISNPGKQLRGGQFVTVTIDLPPPPDVVEVPMTAVVDDGKQCVVFVQPDPSKPHYTMRRVIVTHRFEHAAWVRSKLGPSRQVLKPEEKEAGLLVPQPLLPGERVILSGVLELKKEVEDREATRLLEKAKLAEHGGKKAAAGS